MSFIPESLKNKFKSGNDIKVPQAVITRQEYLEILAMESDLNSAIKLVKQMQQNRLNTN